MKRILGALGVWVGLAGPASAWEFVETSVCTLRHDGAALVEIVFDPAVPDYTITLTRPEGTWNNAPTFGLRFDGPRALAIGTDRHVLSDADRSLSVTDTGFGNVLDGVQYNTVMIAVLGTQNVVIDLTGAAEPMAAFRECPSLGVS